MSMRDVAWIEKTRRLKRSRTMQDSRSEMAAARRLDVSGTIC